MAYRQFTQCTSPNNYIGKLAGQIIVAAAIGAIPLVLGLIFGALALGPGILVAMMIPTMAVIAYCRWWLYDRLICLGGDVCAVGRLLGVEPPSEKSGLDAFDTDYSFGLLLADNDVGVSKAGSEAGPQGVLVTEKPEIAALGVDFSGETSRVHSTDDPSFILHCEFEGGGVHDLLITCLALLGYLTAATVAAVIICSIPVIGWIACLIISLIFAAIGGAILGMGMSNALADQGNPHDVMGNMGDLHPGKDLLVVKGTWVYDSAHTGWNEIHPIKHCQKIGTWADTWDAAYDSIRSLVPAGTTVDAGVYRQFWCDALAKADSPTTHTQQAQPENGWEIHPDIDGCDPGATGGGDDGDDDLPIIK